MGNMFEARADDLRVSYNVKKEITMIKRAFIFLYILTIIICGHFVKAGNPASIHKIDTTELVDIGGIKQFISIRGTNDENPIILFLHGGPGRSLIGFSDKFTDRLRQNFVVVQWDQRETGQTLRLNSFPEELTTERMQNDTYELIKLLLRKFGHKKLYLASHSWGSVLGFYIADRYPELLYAYIPISPMINQVKSTGLTMVMLNNWALRIQNDTAIKELSLVKIPFETKDDLFYFQKWLFIHNEVDFAKKEDFKKVYYDWMSTWFQISNLSIQQNLFEKLHEVHCPVYFFVGVGDNQTSCTIAEDYYAFLIAPKKKIFRMKKSGHTIFNTEPETLQRLIITKVLPDTFN